MSKQNLQPSLAIENGLMEAGKELLYLAGYVAAARDVCDGEPSSVRIARGREAVATATMALDQLERLAVGEIVDEAGDTAALEKLLGPLPQPPRREG
jgi:hypothetical protein